MADMASELEAIAYRLRSAGDDKLARELTRGMRDAVQPVPGEIHAQMPLRLPTRGGYSETMNEDLDVRVIARNPGGPNANAQVAVYGQTRSGKRRRFRRLEQGIIEHPLYGNRHHWYKQAEGVDPAWFAGPCEDQAPAVRDGLERALAQVSDYIAHGG